MSLAHRQPLGPEWVRAWKPAVAGVHEVFHARFVAALNSRPRKTLGWKTPAEALNEQLLLIQRGRVATTP